MKEINLLVVILITSVIKLHKSNIAHRDIKPGNILFFKEDNIPFKLSDFGVS